MTETTPPSMEFDVAKIVARLREIVTNPSGVWTMIRAENMDIPSIYREYLLLLAAIGPVCQLIVNIFGGAPVFTSIVGAGVHYGVGLGFYFAAAVLIELVAPRFESNASRDDAFRLLAFSAFPSLAAGVLILLMPLLGALAQTALLAIVCFSLYILWEGMPLMLGVTKEKRSQFFICLAGSVLLYMLLVQSL